LFNIKSLIAIFPMSCNCTDCNIKLVSQSFIISVKRFCLFISSNKTFTPYCVRSTCSPVTKSLYSTRLDMVFRIEFCNLTIFLVLSSTILCRFSFIPLIFSISFLFVLSLFFLLVSKTSVVPIFKIYTAIIRSDTSRGYSKCEAPGTKNSTITITNKTTENITPFNMPISIIVSMG